MNGHAPQKLQDRRRGRATGAALVVGLVLLLVLTVLGISGINMATLELSMANNAHARALAFEAAASGVELALTGPLDLTAPVRHADRILADGSRRFDAEVVCVAVTLAPAAMEDAAGEPVAGGEPGHEDPIMLSAHFEARVSGYGPRNAVSIQTQGFTVPLPPAVAALAVDRAAAAAANGCIDPAACEDGCRLPQAGRRPTRTYWREALVD